MPRDRDALAALHMMANGDSAVLVLAHQGFADEADFAKAALEKTTFPSAGGRIIPDEMVGKLVARFKEIRSFATRMHNERAYEAADGWVRDLESLPSATAATTREPDFKLVNKDGRTFIYLTRWNIRVGELNTGVSDADAQKVIDFLTKQTSGLHSSDRQADR